MDLGRYMAIALRRRENRLRSSRPSADAFHFPRKLTDQPTSSPPRPLPPWRPDYPPARFIVYPTLFSFCTSLSPVLFLSLVWFVFLSFPFLRVRRVDPTSEEDSYDDVVCVLQLLSHLVTKDLVDQSDEPSAEKVQGDDEEERGGC